MFGRATVRLGIGPHSSSSSSSYFFLAESQQSEIGCLPYFGTWCGPSVNLECRSETCCPRLAGNTGLSVEPLPVSGHFNT